MSGRGVVSVSEGVASRRTVVLGPGGSRPVLGKAGRAQVRPRAGPELSPEQPGSGRVGRGEDRCGVSAGALPGCEGLRGCGRESGGRGVLMPDRLVQKPREVPTGVLSGPPKPPICQELYRCLWVPGQEASGLLFGLGDSPGSAQGRL